MMDQKYLLEIKVREQAATPGPWENGVGVVNDSTGKRICLLLSTRGCFEDENANVAFIANSRTDIPALIAEVERLTAENANLKEQHRCDVHNIAAMQATLDQQAKNCEELIESYKESNLEQATENYELEKENATLKKALELASINISSRLCPPIVCNGRISEGKCTKCWIEYYIHQAEQTHETQEVEK